MQMWPVDTLDVDREVELLVFRDLVVVCRLDEAHDLLDACEGGAVLMLHELKELRVDGGASRDGFLMQFQSDIMNLPLRRPMIRETTALGAAYLAGLAVGFWKDLDEIRQHWTLDKVYTPQMGEEERSRLMRQWHKAVSRSLDWAEH